jgi:hypothetical protein
MTMQSLETQKRPKVNSHTNAPQNVIVLDPVVGLATSAKQDRPNVIHAVPFSTPPVKASATLTAEAQLQQFLTQTFGFRL